MLQVTTSHTGYEKAYKVKDLVANGGAAGYRFAVGDGEETTIAAYFEEKYRQRHAFSYFSWSYQS